MTGGDACVRFMPAIVPIVAIDSEDTSARVSSWSVGSYLGWRWAFWVTLVWLAFNSIGVLTNLNSLANSRAQAEPAAVIAGSLLLCFVALFALGAQASFSSPVRYALLPQHLAPDELVDGNALLEGGTFLSILLGTIAGGIAVALDYGTEAAAVLFVVCAIGGLAASLYVPRAPAPSPSLRLGRNHRPFREADRGHRRILGTGWDPRLSLRCRVASASDGSYPADALPSDQRVFKVRG